jgi:hypothetical protein
MLTSGGAVLFGYKNRCLICLKHMVIIKPLMQIIVQDGQVSLCTENCPVRHISPVDVKPYPLKFLFLTVQR